MGLIEKDDLRALLKDQDLIDEIVAKVIEDPEVLDSLAEDIADDLEDLLEDDPGFKRKVLETAMASPEFKRRIVSELIKEMADD